MEKYYLNTEIKYLNPYIPPRCRKTRYEEKTEQIRIGIRSISSEDAPIAFRLSDYNHVYEHKTEIRYYKGKFYEQMKRFDTRCCYGDERFELVTVKELSIVPYYRCNRSRNDCVNDCKEFAKKHLIIDGFVWRQCGEPMYCVITFGLGHNHGGTGLFVEHFYNHNISNDNYFSALDGKRAVEYANTVAARRGDTNDIGNFNEMIEVLMPQCVKAKPQKQHDKGNEFINKLNTISEIADSAVEAGLLTMLCTF